VLTERTAGAACDDDAVSDALLVVSELTTNAMLHGGGVTDFDVALVGRDLYVSVSDGDHRLPVTSAPAGDRSRWRTGGRGWPIVRRLCREVAVSPLPAGGKRITAVIPLRPVHPGAHGAGREGCGRAGDGA
jgi:anti-sigma regulatory factor (Ser/Thr protein kinase)